MKHVLKNKWRSVIALLLITVVPAGSLLFSNASARTRRANSPNEGAGAAATTARTPNYVAGNFTFGSTKQLLPNAPLPLGFQDVEPEIKVDLFGNIYVTAIEGVPAGVDLWKSTDGGGTFTYLGQPDGAQCPSGSNCTNDVGVGGGDDSIDVSSGGYLYVSSLWLGSVTMSASYDGGIGGVLPGQRWEVNQAAAAVPSDDRQWVAAYGPDTVYMSYRQVLPAGANASNVIFVAKSTDAGKTFPTQTATFPATNEVTARREGNLVVDPYTGNLYTSFRPQELNGHTRAELWFLKSTDGGSTWALTKAYQGPTGSDIGNIFPVMAVDRGGNIHLAFSQCDFDSGTANSSNCQVLLMSSADQGATWLEPVRVNNGPGTSYAILPWMVAGSAGVVDLTWYGADITSSTQSASWHMYFAQTTDAMSNTPTFSQVQAIPQVVHNQDICLKGGACGGNRDLAEYYQLALDPNGNANIAFTDDATNDPSGLGRTWFTKQTGGPSAYTPPAAPAPATFATNINVTGSGTKAEPNSWVDSHNCIFGGAIGGPTAFRSQNGGASFTAKNVVVGTGAHGGDFDIITLPKADGSRPDQIYTADLGITSVHIGKSIDGGNNYVTPGMNGIAGEVSVASDRMWLYPDRGVPTANDQTIYITEHEAASELIRFAALTNDFAWSAFSSGMTSPEFILPPGNTFPNTNPGPVFVNKITHEVIGIFAAASTTTNAQDPPFGKMMNVWAAVGPATSAQGLAPGPFTNYPAFKGVIDSPVQAPSPAPSLPPNAATIGNSCGNLFPSGAADSVGNIYAVWATNNSRFNATQPGGAPGTTYDVWMSASHDGGKNFYGPWKVSSGTGTCVQPWIAAADNGRVDIVYYQSDNVAAPPAGDPSSPGCVTGGPNDMPAGSTWNVMFAQSLNAASREPVFTVSQASDHIVHTGSISACGLTGSSDRSLLDFFEVAIGPDGLGNIFNADNGIAGLHINYARQNSGPLAVTNPVVTTCLPGPPIPTAIVSRKTHGAVGDFDVDLKPPAPGIECRTGGTNNDFKIVVTFPLPITVNGTPKATVTSGTGTVSNVTVSSNQVTIDLTGVTNAQRITVTLKTVTDANGSGDVPINMAVLNGDTTADTFVNSTDIAQTKSQSGQVVTGSNFREDVTADGNINSTDIAFVKSKSGTALP
ncbi:MAG: hypothetical protein QOG48_1362 [Verrucomicrobiota bacterium]|jgi:hypothetical protein